MCRYGTSGHGLIGMVLLDWMVLEVFSNLDMVLYTLVPMCLQSICTSNVGFTFLQTQVLLVSPNNQKGKITLTTLALSN